MSSLKQSQPDIAPLAEDEIAAYLQAHPDFFERHPTLLANLRLPHRTGGAAVSLVEKQVATLRQQNLKLERQLRDLVEVARGNDELAGKIHRLALALLDASDLGELVAVLEQQLRVNFQTDRAVLVLFQAPADLAESRFLRPMARDDARTAPFRTFLEASAPRCGRVRDAQRNFLFGTDDVEIGSVALLPLGPQAELGFLAIGSRDANHFNPGKSIDFLTRLGELVAAALRG